MSDTPTLGPVRKVAALAGQTEYAVSVSYPGDIGDSVVRFVGMVGECGPVVMVSPMGMQTFVTSPSRFGTFGPEWIRRFFA